MDALKYEDLPEIFTPEILERLYEIQNLQTPEWSNIYNKMTDKQWLQFLDFCDDKEQKVQKEQEAQMTQEEKDAQDRAILHWASSRWNEGAELFQWEYQYIKDYCKTYYSRKKKRIELPESIKAIVEYMNPETEEFVYFSACDSPFSNFYPAFFEMNGEKFNSVIHYLMYHKAKLFIDREMMPKILAAQTPEEAHQLGQQVKYFNGEVWYRMYLGNHIRGAIKAKFEQNEDLKQILFNTSGKTIVLSLPDDKIWGIGLSEDDLGAVKRRSWKGMNILGDMLTQVRMELMDGYTKISSVPSAIIEVRQEKLKFLGKQYILPQEISQIEVFELLVPYLILNVAITSFIQDAETEEKTYYKVREVQVKVLEMDENVTLENQRDFQVMVNEQVQHFPKGTKIVVEKDKVKLEEKE